MRKYETAKEALAFVREHGVALVSASGNAPRLTEAIVGGPVRGSWWAHPESRHIYAILESVTRSEQVLVCRLINGKLTLVHRRLWPSLVRLAGRFAPAQLARVREQHTPSGRHASSEMPYPQWVPPRVREQAGKISEQEALAAFGAWVSPSGPARTPGSGAAMVANETHGRFKDVLAAATRDLRPVCRSLRDRIAALHDGFVEVVWPRQRIASFGVGPKKMSEHYAYIAVQRSHVNLGFYHGTSLPDPQRLLEGTGKELRHVKFRDVSSTRDAAVTALLRHAIAERRRHTVEDGRSANRRK